MTPNVSVMIPTLHLTRPRNSDPRFYLFPRYTLQQVLRGLKNNVKLSIEVIIVCNGTDPKLVEIVKTHPVVNKYCLNSVNVGVSRAWNMGAAMAEAEVLCFLNDDVEVGSEAIETLFTVLDRDQSIAQVGPKGAKWRGAEHDRLVGEARIEDADAISGFMFMIRSSQVGGFDVAYTPAGFEEIDMSFALRKHGFRCVVVQGLKVSHYGRHGVSASNCTIDYLNASITTGELHQRNKAYFMRKWNITS
jgi:GT2 family glycosyltransferase